MEETLVNQDISDSYEDIDSGLIKKWNYKDVVPILNLPTEEDNKIMSDIIKNLEECIYDGIKSNKVVAIPYIGMLGKNEVAVELKSERTLIALSRHHMTREDFKQFYRELKEECAERVRIKRQYLTYMRKVRIEQKSKYEKLLTKFGKVYAETWLFAWSMLDYVPFEQDVEDAYQALSDEDYYEV